MLTSTKPCLCKITKLIESKSLWRRRAHRNSFFTSTTIHHPQLPCIALLGLPSNHHLFLLLGLSVWECSCTRVAETSTMAQLIPGDASIVVTRLLILVVWGVTPFCWLALVSRALRFYLNRYTTYSLDAALWRTVVAHAPARITAVLQKLLSPKWRWASTPFYVYCAAEAAFSIYHWHLSRVIQRPGPRPLYGRRFLRGVFAQALQAGLKHPADEKQTYASAVSSSVARATNGHGLTERISNGNPETAAGLHEPSAPSSVRQRLGRLRAASFVPQFVSAPVAADDPRAIKFQQDQARWFFGAPFEHITRREVMHWLAWSLFASDLESLEAERDAHRGLAPSAGLAADEKIVESATPSTFSSPMPPSGATFGGIPPAWTTGSAAGSVVEQEDVRGVRAKEGEWDPTMGDRLQFLEYCLELLETRQGRSFPEHAPGEGSHDGKHARNDSEGRGAQDAAAACQAERQAQDADDAADDRPGAHTHAAARMLSGDQHAVVPHHPARGSRRLRDVQAGPAAVPVPRRSLVARRCRLYAAHRASRSGHWAGAVRVARFVLPALRHVCAPTDRDPAAAKHLAVDSVARVPAAVWTPRDDLCVPTDSGGARMGRDRRAVALLWVPYVCANFVYKRASTPIEMLMRYFVARELGTANTLCRYFDWSSNILWPNEIERLADAKYTRFYLAEEDAILNAKDTYEYLVESGCPRENIHYGERRAHGEMLMHGGDDFANIVHWLSMQV
ncbi:hypothetical protein L1887_61958 [Cichorium endivia]|nr:hypothetical protein L1887_61958 [Cichorium endivia]